MARKPRTPKKADYEAYLRFPSGLPGARVQAIEAWLGWCRKNHRNPNDELLGRAHQNPSNRRTGHSMDVFLRAQVDGSKKLGSQSAKGIVAGIRLRLPR